LPSTKSKKW